MSGAFWMTWILIIDGAVIYHTVEAQASLPTFASPISSLTVAVGRDAVLKCVVDNLGDYRVAWIHVDKQVLLTIHTHVIIRSKRVGVSHHNFRTWFLHLKNVQPEDSGYYMCQINTQPMISQVGHLDIVVPPEFVNDHASRNISVMENGNVSLSCRATGNPIPKMKWRREDGQMIYARDQQVALYDGEELVMVKVSRQSMGAYLCIASNGVPPAISRRMHVDVTFPPMIWIPNQQVGAAEGSTIALECHTEAHPPANDFWIRNGNVIGSSSDKFEASLVSTGYKIHMKLLVKDLKPEDFGKYRCISKNALGETEGSVNLYRIRAPPLFNGNPSVSPVDTPNKSDHEPLDDTDKKSESDSDSDTSVQQLDTVSMIHNGAGSTTFILLSSKTFFTLLIWHLW